MVGGISITLANVIVAIVMFAMIVGVGITIGRHDRRTGGPQRRAREREAPIPADASRATSEPTPSDADKAGSAATARPATPDQKNVPANSGNRKR